MWESGAFGRISKRGVKSGKLAVGVFQAFLSAPFPPRRFRIAVCTERSDALAIARFTCELAEYGEVDVPARRFERGSAAGAIFEVEAHFVHEDRKKSRLEGRRRIFPGLGIVWVMAFFGMRIDATAMVAGSSIAQNPFPLSSLRAELPFNSMWWALWTKRSRILSARVGSPICSCQRLTGI